MPNQNHRRGWLGPCVAVMIVLTASSAAWMTWYAWVLIRLPYNELGRHFDGLVVHHEGTGEWLAAVAVILWTGAGLLLRLYGRIRRRPVRPPSTNDGDVPE